jgi:hypothetical protein
MVRCDALSGQGYEVHAAADGWQGQEQSSAGVVPGLLPLLGDANKDVRASAKTALEQIRF